MLHDCWPLSDIVDHFYVLHSSCLLVRLKYIDMKENCLICVYEEHESKSK